ncbi:MAG: hypothetical protein EHM28_03320 [Spirochaetaceae bacterium]|nr:MAG: hypothetical protein EHM28_03320 [Spirochaetaceae bacterium]
MRFPAAILIVISVSVLFVLAQAGCATPEPVSRELPGLVGPVNPDRNVILRIAVEFLELNRVADQYDPESAIVIFRNWEAHYVEVHLYPWIEREKRTSIIRVFAMDGYAEWSSQAAVDRLKAGH